MTEVTDDTGLVAMDPDAGSVRPARDDPAPR